MALGCSTVCRSVKAVISLASLGDWNTRWPAQLSRMGVAVRWSNIMLNSPYSLIF